MKDKTKFINTCDAMLHARQQGESFGLAIGEFAVRNKPVITFNGGDDQNHIKLLKDKGFFYNNKTDLKSILNSFKPDPDINYDCYSQNFNPEVVMRKFEDVFIK